MHRSGSPAGAANSEAVKAQAALVEALRNPTLYDYGVNQVTVMETHISYVLLIVSLSASPETLRDRLNGRSGNETEASDADSAVLDYQQRTQEPLTPDKLPQAIAFQAANSEASAALCQTVRARLA